jgi:hypothetical protein
MSRAILVLMLLCGVCSDGILTGISILEILTQKNLFTYILAFAAGLVVTGLTASTKYIFDTYSTGLTLLWGGAVLIDGTTTVMGILRFVQPNEPVQYATVLTSIVLVTGSSLMFSYVVED